MPRKPSSALLLFTAWLIPGGGHLLLGRRTQALVFFLVITSTFAGGMWLADFTNVSPQRNFYYFLAHVLNGGETALAVALTADHMPQEVPTHFGMATAEIGSLYTAVAALLNVLAMMNAWGIRLGIEEGEE